MGAAVPCSTGCDRTHSRDGLPQAPISIPPLRSDPTRNAIGVTDASLIPTTRYIGWTLTVYMGTPGTAIPTTEGRSRAQVAGH